MKRMTGKEEECQYLRLVEHIINNGSREQTRNGLVYHIFGNQMRFSLQANTIPLLTTKFVAWKTCFKELMWFIRGNTDSKQLESQGVHIWRANGTREFLDQRGLSHLEEGDLGPIYGHQWRHFNAEYTTSHNDYTGKGVDQLQYIINSLKDPDQRTSRRLVMSAWNPCQLDQMALPPCHVLCQFNVREGKYLSCALYQRSCDMGLGVPFNIASYSFLTHLLAHHCSTEQYPLQADEFVYMMGNVHVYESHVDPLKEQCKREPVEDYPFPQFKFVGAPRENIGDYTVDDIEWISEYKYQPTVKMQMIA